MATTTNADVHLEAVEEAENEGTELAKAGGSEGASIPMGEYSIGILANCWKRDTASLYYK